MDNVVAVPITQAEAEKPSADAGRNLRVEPAKVMTPAGEENAMAPFSKYKSQDGLPYTAEFLDLGEFFTIDVEGDIKQKVMEIDAYLLEKMAGDALVYGKAWLEKITGELSFRPDESPVSKLERLYKYIKVKERLEGAALKKALLKKQIDEEVEHGQ